MKQDRFGVNAAAPGARADLTRLSCRWKPIDNTRGCILSLTVGPADGVRTGNKGGDDIGDYDLLVGQVIELFEEGERGGQPIPESGPDMGWPPKGADLEARSTTSEGSRRKAKLKIMLFCAFAWILFKTG